jgi:TetR/AcrR family transcriptional repressor of mexCD-oprJ operon
VRGEGVVASRGRAATKHAILAAAASVFAARQGASMAEVAAAAGIARGTLYRHFPTRESLLRALERAANEGAGRRLAEANLDGVPVDEALARVVRALVAVGEDFIVLLRERRPPEPGCAGPLVALIERGVRTARFAGTFRSRPWSSRCSPLMEACVRTGRAAGMESEDMSSSALGLFLAGARPAAD